MRRSTSTLIFFVLLSLVSLGCARESSLEARNSVSAEEVKTKRSEDLCRPAESDGEEFLKSGIVGGKILKADTRLGTRVALIVFEKEGQTHLCSGTLITNDVVLTAAHCVISDFTAMRVVFTNDFVCGGNEESRLARRVYKVKNAIPHHDFYQKDGRVNIENDLAIIQIVGLRPADMKPLPISLQPSIQKEERLLLLGYGMSSEAAQDAGRLRIAAKRGRDLLSLPSLPSGFLLDQKHSGICSGDSGGPMLRLTDKGLELVGVASAILSLDEGTPGCGGYSFYVDINKHLDWLRQALVQLRQKSPVSP